MQVLALVPGGIEEQLSFLPAINRLGEAFPKAEIAVVADPLAKDAYRLSKATIDFIPYGFQSHNSPADWANLLGMMRDREFEVVLTGTTSWSMGLLLWLSGIPTRIGFASPANQLFLTQTLPAQPDQRGVGQFYPLLAGLDLQTKEVPALSINVPQGDITVIESLRQSAGIGSQGYVLVYPGQSSTGEQYPIEAWATIVKGFQNRQSGMPVVLVQTVETAEQTTQLMQMAPGIKAIAPGNLGQLAALVAGANLMVTVDAYPLYVAAALQVYALGLFGRAQPDQKLPAQVQADAKVMTIRADSGELAAISPELVLKKIWSE